MQLIYGPPGTGKTTRLLSIMERELQAGVRPDRIAVLAFTKKAAGEFHERACERFSFSASDMPYVRTIHSLAFKQLGMRSDRMMGWRHYDDLGRMLGIELKGRSSSLDSDLYGMQAGDRLLFLEGLSRLTQKPLYNVWADADELDIDFRELDRVSRALAEYKRNNGLVDYTDLLEEFVRRAPIPALDVLIVDEAQDLSKLQWAAVERIAAQTQRVYIAGDDDQAVFAWSGADVAYFLGLQGQTTVLDQSYRIPLVVHKLAAQIVGRIQNRKAKQWKARAEQGVISWYADPEEVDLSKGSWLLLARNGYMLRGLEDTCRRQGFAYTSVDNNPLDSPALKASVMWEKLRRGGAITKPDAAVMLRYRTSPPALPKAEWVTMARLGIQNPPPWNEYLNRIDPDDAEFYKSVHRRGELLKKPRIRISTIHSTKGGESDSVLLLTDMSARTYREMQRNPDAEARCWYVAVTRAKQGLHLIQPRTGNYYEI